MTAFLTGIIQFFQAIVSFLENLIVGMGQMLIMIPSAVNMLVQSIGYMPSILVAFATAFITVSVTYLIIGR